MRFAVIINTASGSCNVGDETVLTQIIEENGGEVVSRWCGGADGLKEAFSTTEERKPECLVVLGGDGTIRSAVEACKNSVAQFILLPGGTMNMLTKAIYGDLPWKEILETTLKNPKEQTISCGVIGDKTFYVAAILGTPSLLAHTREAARNGDIGAAVVHGAAVLATPFISFEYESHTEEGNAETLLITTPLVSDALSNDARALDVVAVATPGAFETLRILSAAALGIWRSDENVTTHATRSLKVSAPEPIPATLDGEPVDLPREVTVTFVPAAFTVLTPDARK